MSAELIVIENNRLIKESLFSKKLIKCLQNIMHFSIQLKTNCKCNENQWLIHQNEHHFQSYHCLYNEWTSSAGNGCGRKSIDTQIPATKTMTTQITKVMDNISEDLMDESSGHNRANSRTYGQSMATTNANVIGICVGHSVKSVTKSDFYKYQRLLRPVMKSVSTNTANQMAVTAGGCVVPGLQCSACGHQVLTPEEMYAHQRHVHHMTRIDDCLMSYECSDRNCTFKCPDGSAWLDHKRSHERNGGTIVFNKRTTSAPSTRQTLAPVLHNQSYVCVADGHPTTELSLAISSISSGTDGTVVLNAVPIHGNGDEQLVVYPTMTATGGLSSEVMYRTYELKNFNPMKCTHCSYSIKKDNQNHSLMRVHVSEQHPTHSSDFDKCLAAKAINTSYVFECLDCKHILDDQQVLELHHQTVHSATAQTYRLLCDLCSYTTDSYQEFNQHNSRHRSRTAGRRPTRNTNELLADDEDDVETVDAPQDDDDDDQQVLDESTVSTSHLVANPIQPSKKFVCTQEDCRKAFKHEFLLIKHLRNYHKLIECHKCLTRFKTIQLLNAHLLKSHREYLIRCQSCDYQTFWPSFHDRHVKRHHLTQWWTCQHKNCTERFLKEVSLEKHTNRVHKRGFRPYECDECAAQYYTNADLTRHLGRVHKALVYLCDDCDYKCCDAGALSAHHNDKHVGRLYKCQFEGCDYETRQSAAFNGHWNRCHSRRFVCEYAGCGRVYSNRTALDRHFVRHPFSNVCDASDCGRDFMSYKALALHRWSAHNVPMRPRQQPCADCHRVFSTGRSLALHRKTRHSTTTTSV